MREGALRSFRCVAQVTPRYDIHVQSTRLGKAAGQDRLGIHHSQVLDPEIGNHAGPRPQLSQAFGQSCVSIHGLRLRLSWTLPGVKFRQSEKRPCWPCGRRLVTALQQASGLQNLWRICRALAHVVHLGFGAVTSAEQHAD